MSTPARTSDDDEDGEKEDSDKEEATPSEGREQPEASEPELQSGKTSDKDVSDESGNDGSRPKVGDGQGGREEEEDRARDGDEDKDDDNDRASSLRFSSPSFDPTVVRVHPLAPLPLSTISLPRRIRYVRHPFLSSRPGCPDQIHKIKLLLTTLKLF